MASDQDRTSIYVAALVKHISRGRLDVYLDDIFEAIRERKNHKRNQLAAHNRVILKPGVRVKIANGIKPRYLAGLKGTVIDPEQAGHLPRGNNGAIPIRLDFGKVRRYGPTVFVPPGAMSKLKDQTPNPEHAEYYDATG